MTAQDLVANSNVQDAFVIAVEKQARERLERLSALKKIKPVDMTKLSQQVRPFALLARRGRRSLSLSLSGPLLRGKGQERADIDPPAHTRTHEHTHARAHTLTHA